MGLEQPKFEADELAPVEKSGEAVKKSAEIFYFPRKAEVGTPEETERTYEAYRTSGGILNQEQYKEVLMRVAEGAEDTRSHHIADQASSMAKASGITLSPEIVAIYGVLRHGNPGEKREDYRELSDQHLLAEALRIVGDTSSLNVFVGIHPHIFH